MPAKNILTKSEYMLHIRRTTYNIKSIQSNKPYSKDKNEPGRTDEKWYSLWR